MTTQTAPELDSNRTILASPQAGNTGNIDHLLLELRRLSLRARAAAVECDSIGLVLKSGAISPEAAVSWLADVDPLLIDLLGAPLEIAA
jgi:hypothetical protein